MHTSSSVWNSIIYPFENSGAFLKPQLKSHILNEIFRDSLKLRSSFFHASIFLIVICTSVTPWGLHKALIYWFNKNSLSWSLFKALGTQQWANHTKPCPRSTCILVGWDGLTFQQLFAEWMVSYFHNLTSKVCHWEMLLDLSNSSKYFNLPQSQGKNLTESSRRFLTWKSPGLVRSPDI